MVRRIDVNELAKSMKEHIELRGNSDVVNLLWAGYLAALMIEGFLSADEYHDLNDTLKDVGREELREIFLGLPEPGDDEL